MSSGSSFVRWRMLSIMRAYRQLHVRVPRLISILDPYQQTSFARVLCLCVWPSRLTGSSTDNPLLLQPRPAQKSIDRI